MSSLKTVVGFNLIFLHVFCVITLSYSVSTEPEVRRLSFRELLRVRRQVCADGTYTHDGKTCCLCSAGQHLIGHCKTSTDNTQCEICQPGSTYSSHPNSKESCEPCTSCSHENANLEVEESCTIYRDTKCKCKKDHYCPSGTGTCTICQPCDKCDFTGVKEPCSATSNAVCNEESKGLGGGPIAGIVITLLVVVLVFVGLILFRKKIQERPYSPNTSNPVTDPLLPVDMAPHLADVAEILGWKDMKAVAMSIEMSAAIESAQLSHPSDSDTWTIELLKRWHEKTGRTASVELIKILQSKNKKSKAEKIRETLYGGNDATQSCSA
ncbi:hypothetical protein CHARACLAT_019188 [Characodon lateralis]|uniref:TNFR-Cys domain-containing protein n=1 Tax=Characodon lateralis TaxID=208331 RepID=A0ABU7DVX6_9TELE|nr:hypothetical protein [Characodon lateralis]